MKPGGQETGDRQGTLQGANQASFPAVWSPGPTPRPAGVGWNGGVAWGALRHRERTSCLNQDSLCPRSCPTSSQALPICSSRRKCHGFLPHLLIKQISTGCLLWAGTGRSWHREFGDEQVDMGKWRCFPPRRAHSLGQGRGNRSSKQSDGQSPGGWESPEEAPDRPGGSRKTSWRR